MPDYARFRQKCVGGKQMYGTVRLRNAVRAFLIGKGYVLYPLDRRYLSAQTWKPGWELCTAIHWFTTAAKALSAVLLYTVHGEADNGPTWQWSMI